MLHASVRAVGPIAGGPDQIHLALKDALTPTGTLIMYAGCPSYTDEIGRGQLTPDQERELLEKLPPFDPFTARAQRENATLVEFLRTFRAAACRTRADSDSCSSLASCAAASPNVSSASALLRPCPYPDSQRTHAD